MTESAREYIHLRLVPIFATSPDVPACQRYVRPRGEMSSDRSKVTCPDCLTLMAKERLR
jgi:hypothetical protein